MKKPQQPADNGAPAKTSSITLRANGAMLTLLATLKKDGTAITTVTQRDADKKTSRGMTESHATMDVAKAHLSALAKKAEATGWQRGIRSVATKPDAFNRVPAPPKVTA